MSVSVRFRRVNRISRSIVVAMGVLLGASIASAGPQLWLYPGDDGSRQGGHVVPPGDFTLVIENRGNGSGDTTAYGVQLVVAVEELDAVDELELIINDDALDLLDPDRWKVGTPLLPCGDKPMPRHGVYPTAYTLVVFDHLPNSGDLAGGESVEIKVTVVGDDDLRVHFDAMASDLKTTGRGDKCSGFSNPAGHDVTVGQRPGGHDDCGRVKITKVADEKYVDVGETVVFMIDVMNEGSCDLTEPVLRDFIPAVEDVDGNFVPAFTVSGGTDPSPPQDEDFLVEWGLNSPLPPGELDGVLLEVIVELAADGQRVVNRACISAEELRKPRCAAAVIIVGNPNGDDGPAGPGFWCHAVRFILEDRRNAPVSAEEFDEWLVEIGEGDRSRVFNELYDASTRELAHDLLCTPQFAEDVADRLTRHLLTLWLNVVSGRLTTDQELDGLCDGDELMPADVDPTTVMALIVAVEDALLNAETEDDMLSFWSEVVDAVNNSLVPGEPGCTAARVASGRQRAGSGKPGSKMKIPGVHN